MIEITKVIDKFIGDLKYELDAEPLGGASRLFVDFKEKMNVLIDEFGGSCVIEDIGARNEYLDDELHEFLDEIVELTND